MPPVVAALVPKGRLAATNDLPLAIGLTLQDAPGLAAFLAAVSDPASPHFRQFLTPAECTARFGPTATDYARVMEFAMTNGLTITTTYSNRLVLDVTGPVAAVEKAFHLHLQTYRHPTEARDFFAPDAEPSVDPALPVADLQGLSNFWRPRSRMHGPANARRQPKNGSAPDGSGSYIGDDFRNAYLPGVTLTGAGQCIGLLEFDGFYDGDIAAYAAAAGNGRTNVAIQTVLLDNFDGTPTGANNGNAEVSLDIEMAMAMAPGLSAIVVFEAGPGGKPNDLLNSMLSAAGRVKNLSCSWGWGGGPDATTDNIFNAMAAVGQSFFNASGDTDAFTPGASSVNGVDNASKNNAPSSSPMITQVGGTTLTLSRNGDSYVAETTWNRDVEFGSADDGVGSSGGVSAHYSIPGWQTNINNLAGAGGSAWFRNIPDVALTAEDIYVVSGGHAKGVGGNAGTSCAAPLWAGFLALVNQQAAALGLPPAGFINPALYAFAAGPDYAACFHDVTTGNNAWSASPGFFYATNGYDLCTGLGSPNGTSLINALASSGSLMISPLTGAATGVAGGPFSQAGNFLLTNTGSFALSWSLVNTSAWLGFSATNGTLAAAAQTNLAASLTAAASNLPAGTYPASLIFSNGTFQVALNRGFTLLVNQPLVILPTNGFAASGVAGGAFGSPRQSYSLTNLGGSSLSWSVINTSLWLAAAPDNGSLPGGAQTNLTLSLTPAAGSLAAGIYTANVLVTNFAGLAASLPFTLNVRQEIVNNGGFETGTFSGWTLTGSSAFNIVTPSTTFVHSGAYGAALAQYGSLGYLQQTLATLPGRHYQLSLWLENPANPAGATPNQFLIQWDGTTLFNGTNLPFTPWTNLQFIVTASSASTELQLGFEDTPYYLGLDDISVTPLAPPQLLAAQARGSGFDLTWSTIPTLLYQVQCSTNLLPANWLDLGSLLTAATNTLGFADTNPASASPCRFYRVIELP